MKVYARDCRVVVIESLLADEFLLKYHLQRTCEGQLVCLGLFYNDELIGVMTFGYPRYNHNAAWELLRLCYKSDFIVVGGSQKLFNFFVSLKEPDNIISYCNLDLFSGKVYEDLKFKRLGSASETFKWMKDKEWISDAQLLKYGADKLIGTTDGKGTNNADIMLREGWQKVHYQTVQTYIWDSQIDGIIYKITNVVNRKCYIGQSRYSDDRRWRDHIYYGTKDSLIDRAINKYGKENFTYEIVDRAYSFYELNKKEREWIAKLKPEYNTQPGGYTTYVKVMPPESRNTEALKLYWSDPENRKRMGDMHKGIPLSEAHKAAISVGARRAIATPETQARREEAGKHRRPCSEETKRKLSETHKAIAAKPDYVHSLGNTGHNHTEKVKKQLSEHSKLLWRDPIYREQMVQKRKEQAQNRKGVHWFNNGVTQIMAFECPEGFVKGKLKK